MSLQDKKTFVSDVEEQIGDFLTVTHTRAVKQVLDSELTKYEVESIAPGEINLDPLEAFLRAKSVEGKSELTVNHYRERCTIAIKYIGKPIDRITTDDLRTYFEMEKQKGLSDVTLNGYRACLSSMFSWLMQNGLIKGNPICGITSISHIQEVKQPYSSIEMDLLKDGCKTIRDKAIILFFYSTGARVSEVCRLNRKDIDLISKKCKVLGKGGKERIVFFDSLTAAYLQKYLETRTDDDPALFAGKRGRLTKRGIEKMMQNLAKNVGLEKVHPHKFRRTFTTDGLRNGVPVQVMAKMLGHSSIQTTMRYTYISDSDMESEYRRHIG